MSDPLHNSDEPRIRREFVSTQWSLILTARGPGEAGEAALDQICRIYWPPLFAYARRDGRSPADAQDAVQSFLAHLLARKDIDQVGPEKGRFRSFLLAAFKHFLISETRNGHALKRGGGTIVVQLQAEDLAGAEARDLADAGTPDRAFDRSWARQLMAQALQRLGEEHRAPRQAELFAALQSTLMEGGRVQGEADIAARLGLTPGALAVAATRLRRRYRALIEDEVKRTLANPADLAEEMRALRLAWS